MPEITKENRSRYYFRIGIFSTIVTIITSILVGVFIWGMVHWADQIREGIELDYNKLEDYVEDRVHCTNGNRIISDIRLDCDREGCENIYSCNDARCGVNKPGDYICWRVQTLENISSDPVRLYLDQCYGEIPESEISSNEEPINNCGFRITVSIVPVVLPFIFFGLLLVTIALCCVSYDIRPSPPPAKKIELQNYQEEEEEEEGEEEEEI